MLKSWGTLVEIWKQIRKLKIGATPTPFPFPLLICGILGLVHTHLFPFSQFQLQCLLLLSQRKTNPRSLLISRAVPFKAGFYHLHAALQISAIQTDFLRKLLNTDFPIARSLEPWLIHANNELGKQMSCEIIACEWHGGNKCCCVLDHADSSTRGKEKGELFSHSHCVGLSGLRGIKCPAA